MAKRNNSAVQYVINFCKKSIAKGDYMPGEKLIMADIAQRLGVSRIPVAEALQNLHTQGLVELINNKGAVVKKYSTQEARDIYEVWTHLEIMSMKQAAANFTTQHEKNLQQQLQKQKAAVSEDDTDQFVTLNERFHLTCAKIAGNYFLYDLLQNVFERVNVLRLISLWVPNRLMESYSEHIEIIDCLKSKDDKKIEQQVKQHIERGFEYITK